MANVFTNPTYRTPLVGDGRGDFACPPDHLTLDEVVTAFEEAGLDPDRVNSMVIGGMHVEEAIEKLEAEKFVPLQQDG